MSLFDVFISQYATRSNLLSRSNLNMLNSECNKLILLLTKFHKVLKAVHLDLRKT